MEEEAAKQSDSATSSSSSLPTAATTSTRRPSSSSSSKKQPPVIPKIRVTRRSTGALRSGHYHYNFESIDNYPHLDPNRVKKKRRGSKSSRKEKATKEGAKDDDDHDSDDDDDDEEDPVFTYSPEKKLGEGNHQGEEATEEEGTLVEGGSTVQESTQNDNGDDVPVKRKRGRPPLKERTPVAVQTAALGQNSPEKKFSEGGEEEETGTAAAEGELTVQESARIQNDNDNVVPVKRKRGRPSLKQIVAAASQKASAKRERRGFRLLVADNSMADSSSSTSSKDKDKIPVKRGRGRPRKYPLEKAKQGDTAVKRSRGRPRKYFTRDHQVLTYNEDERPRAGKPPSSEEQKAENTFSSSEGEESNHDEDEESDATNPQDSEEEEDELEFGSNALQASRNDDSDSKVGHEESEEVPDSTAQDAMYTEDAKKSNENKVEMPEGGSGADDADSEAIQKVVPMDESPAQTTGENEETLAAKQASSTLSGQDKPDTAAATQTENSSARDEKPQAEMPESKYSYSGSSPIDTPETAPKISAAEGPSSEIESLIEGTVDDNSESKERKPNDSVPMQEQEEPLVEKPNSTQTTSDSSAVKQQPSAELKEAPQVTGEATTTANTESASSGVAEAAEERYVEMQHKNNEGTEPDAMQLASSEDDGKPRAHEEMSMGGDSKPQALEEATLGWEIIEMDGLHLTMKYVRSNASNSAHRLPWGQRMMYAGNWDSEDEDVESARRMQRAEHPGVGINRIRIVPTEDYRDEGGIGARIVERLSLQYGKYDGQASMMPKASLDMEPLQVDEASGELLRMQSGIAKEEDKLSKKKQAQGPVLLHDVDVPNLYAFKSRRPTGDEIFPPVVLDKDETSGLLPKSLSHLPPDTKVTVLDRRTGKVYADERAVPVKDLVSLLEANASLEPIIPPPGLDQRNGMEIVREARSAPATTVCGTVRRQRPSKPPLKCGEVVRITKGKSKNELVTFERSLPGGWSEVRKRPPDDSSTFWTPTEYLTSKLQSTLSRKRRKVSKKKLQSFFTASIDECYRNAEKKPEKGDADIKRTKEVARRNVTKAFSKYF